MKFNSLNQLGMGKCWYWKKKLVIEPQEELSSDWTDHFNKPTKIWTEASVHMASGQKLNASNFSVNLYHPPREQPLIWTQELLLLSEIITNSKNLIITMQIYAHLPTKKLEWTFKKSTMMFLNGRNMDDQFLYCFFQTFLNEHRFFLQLKKTHFILKIKIFLELNTWKYISSDKL